ncbi:tyrosine-protein kinase JAK2-like isoform X1 [Ostrea edulis]|uniref:tyrosine-protein kinase JAK2-like isoform X1 n=1 Tax=Ostrea edulis TaxID=37623 RepID=UPI0024AED230|nr:tyrosine-protein kinase JAK2-like isoform X1 [Ostrea edulis]
MSNMSKTQLLNSDASTTTTSTNSHTESVPGGSAETGPSDVSSTHTQVTNLTSTTLSPPSSSSSSPEVMVSPPIISSAALDSQPVQQNLTQISVSCQSVVVHVQIELHDGTVYVVNSNDDSKVVEDLCIYLLRKHFPKMGPAAVQLFGLASVDKKRIPKMLWVNPCITMGELKKQLSSPTANAKHIFYLRIRYVPGRKFVNNLPVLGQDLLKYLYLQCKDDFVKSRLSDIYEQDIKNEAKARGYAVLSIVIASKMEDKDFVEVLNKQKLDPFLPSHLIARFWRGVQLKKNMKTKTEEFLSQHCNTSVEELWLGYIKDVLNEVQNYGVERYEAKQVSGSLRPVQLTLDVQQHEENGSTPYKGLFIHNEFFSSIDNFRAIHISPNHADQKKSWNVHLDRSNGCPEVLRFESKAVAESFVSGINGYYRLITDYYMNLYQQMELPSLQEINKLKCHGPIETNTAVRKLKTKNLSEEYYILKQSMLVFDQLAILFCNAGQTRKRLIDRRKNQYCLEGEPEEMFKDINSIIKYMSDNRNLLPKRPVKVKPQQEPVDVLRKLFVEEIIPDEEEETALNNQKRKPNLILPEDIQVKEPTVCGSFTEVLTCDLDSGTVYAAKRLRQTSSDQMFRCYEHFQHAVQQLIRMEDPKFFVRVHGLVLSNPPMLVMERAQHGSLATFFRKRQSNQPIKPFHLLNAASQMAHGMLYLNEKQLVHGNLCCRNLLVFRYEIDDILVKIGDPGMVNLLNTLDLLNPQNRHRLLYLAPELYTDYQKWVLNPNVSKMTTQSDVFAFGTTLWEMFADGHNPVETPRFSNLSSEKVLQAIFNKKLDPPPSLNENIEWKQKLRNLMSSCWKPVDDRPDPKLLLRDLRAQVADLESSSSRDQGYSSINKKLIQDDNFQVIGSNGDNVPDLISSTQESQTWWPVKDTMSPSTEPTLDPPSFLFPTNSAATNRDANRASDSVINRSLPDLPLDLKYIISSRRLSIRENKIGAGHYGVVKRGLLYASPEDRSNPLEIAAKELKGDFQNVIDSTEFKEEAILMSKLEHANVVKFLGISDNMLILEYVENGALNMYLRKFRKRDELLPEWRLIKMITDVAQGMAYLANMRVIHCDLAGRNVLLTNTLVAKITDFGLAKILKADKDYYTRSSGKELPLMWCSPESIANRKFTTKGDIWSYGILIWEVFTHAKAPILCNNFSKEGYQKLMEGKRLKKTTHCPVVVYKFMEKCWEFRPEDRPDFNEACEYCRKFSEEYPEPKEEVHKSPHPQEPLPPVPPVPIELTDTGNDPHHRPSGILGTDQQTGRPGIPIMANLPPSEDLKYMINTNHIKLGEEVIGKGHFGYVKQGEYSPKGKESIKIAVKVFKNPHSKKIEMEMVKEVDVLGTLEHPHIVKFYGFTKKPDLMMIMEYVENGSLRSYLEQTRAKKSWVPDSRLIAIVIDITKGMEYLTDMKVFHCDLAARNILLTKDYTAKIADFGLSKLMTSDKDYYTRKGQEVIPLQWCAPEVIGKTKYSSKTDVWSFGVVMWECFSQGEVPRLCSVEKEELKTITFFYLEKGGRLEKPDGCHEEVYGLMKKCWEWEAEKRPPFYQIHQQCLKLQEILGKD